MLGLLAIAVCLPGLTSCRNETLPQGSPRLLIVGWDGATWDLIDPLLAEGRLPNLLRLIRAGAQAELESTIVPISSAA